ncbi:unnamed protein product, partial [Mesorhabditis belari]|uniref:P-type ATPase N-terminal domain-containing protein n=1 Tax=Mesorhabditis belari TaxID=2138241 RepID=A0AAF3FFA5_9BILA
MLESLKEKFCCKSRTETCNITIGHLLKNGVSNHLYTTKYSLLNFLPKFFYAQFTEPSNLFFLILTLIQLYPGISPFAWHTSGFPLIVIISVNALIEIYEDMKRRLSDQRVNNTKVEALDFKTGEWQFLKWKDLRESQLVRLGSDDKVPADLILLSSSEPGGIIYMETSNLDGEASLKIRQATPYTLAVDSIERVKILVDSESEIHYEAPSRALDRFQGVLKIKKDILPMTSRWSDRSCLSINGDEKCAHVPLSASNLIFRGATIQNTDWLLGVVVHAGRSTKLAKNSIKKSSKTSIIHRLTSWMVVTQIGWLLLMSAPIAFWSKTGDESWFKTYYGDVGGVQSTMFGLFLAELILFSNLVPISLYITIEGCLMWQAYYLGQDLFLYDETRDQRVEVRSFKMIPNLGRVKYVLSDKTGTLTTNTMCFKFCSIGGQKYGKRSSKGKEFNTDKLLKELRLNAKGNSNSIDLFLLACAVCHTVVVDKKKNDASKEHGETSLSNIVSLRMTVPDSPQPKKPRESIFHACSPDEKCLVKFAKQARYAFTARTPDSISVEVVRSD